MMVSFLVSSRFEFVKYPISFEAFSGDALRNHTYFSKYAADS
jgi:hypothetical protein